MTPVAYEKRRDSQDDRNVRLKPRVVAGQLPVLPIVRR